MQKGTAAYNTSCIHTIDHTAHLSHWLYHHSLGISSESGLKLDWFCARPSHQTHQIQLTKIPTLESQEWKKHLHTHCCVGLLIHSFHEEPEGCCECMLYMLCCARLCLNQVDLQPLMILLAVKHHRNIARFLHDLACCCCHPVDNVASERLSRPVNNWLQDADFTCMIRWISAMPSSMSSDNLYTSIILFDGYSSRANRTGNLTKCGGKSHLDLGTRLTGLRSRCT